MYTLHTVFVFLIVNRFILSFPLTFFLYTLHFCTLLHSYTSIHYYTHAYIQYSYMRTHPYIITHIHIYTWYTHSYTYYSTVVSTRHVWMWSPRISSDICNHDNKSTESTALADDLTWSHLRSVLHSKKLS